MIVIRIILAVIGAIAMSLMLLLAVLVAGCLTLYQGLVNHDWCEDKWNELLVMIPEIYDYLKDFVLYG